jgi:glutathione peroxidase
MKLMDSLQNSLDKLQNRKENTLADPVVSIYEIPVTSLNGEPLDMKQFKGKYLLIVNVASRCGFTKQYKAMEAVYQEYGDQLAMLGMPCNQFAGQEPGDAEEIQAFCDRHFGLSFPLSEKVKVKGPQKHPVYSWLTKADQNGSMNTKVKWNFQKYLIDPEGRLVDVFYSVTAPDSKKILRYLN